MRIIDITHPPQSLWIGREGENTFRPVSFECANWFVAYPDATIAAYYQPYGANDPYPLVLVEDGTKRIWHPLLNELVKGDGELQIVLMQGETVGTSAIIPTKVDRSLISNKDHPASESPSWAVKAVQDVKEQADRAEAAADRAEAAADRAEEAYDPAAIADAVEDYLDEHPVSVEESDPTVPAWAKQPTKPTYTAQEVGALPSDTPIPAAVTEQTVAGWGFTKNTGTYSKPSGGIPASDLASGVIPTVPQMATQADMSDWTSGKTVDAAVLKKDFTAAALELNDLSVNKADRTDIPTAVSELTNDSGFVTAQQAAAAAPVQSVNGMTGAVTIPTGSSDAVLYTPQTPTDAQKAQARTNIGAGTYSKPSGGIPKSDLASALQTSLGKADTALQPAALQTELDNNVPPARFVLVMNGNTLTTVDQFISIANLLVNTPRRVMFIIVVSQSGGTVTSALELYPTMIDTNNRLLTLVGYFDGSRYTAELTAASPSSTMTGTLMVEPIKELPSVTAADNGKFLRVANGAWAAQAVPAAESNSFGGGA